MSWNIEKLWNNKYELSSYIENYKKMYDNIYDVLKKLFKACWI